MRCFPRLLSGVFLFCVLFVSATGLAEADQELTLDPQQQFGFAESVFKEGDYYRAVGEYKRFIYLFPENPLVKEALYQVGLAYFKDRQFDQAAAYFQRVIQEYPQSDLWVESHFMISRCHLQANAPDAALMALEHLAQKSADADIKDEVYYRMGWIHIGVADWEKGRAAFARISAPNKTNFRLKELSQELDQVGALKKKSPALAGTLALLPGAGYLYTERYQDALVAFGINAAFMYAAYESFNNDNNAIGAILTLIELGFYSGSIYGSISSAHKYNRKKERDFIQDLMENKRIRLSGGYTQDGFAVVLNYRF